VLANPIDERFFAFGSGFRLQALPFDKLGVTPAKQPNFWQFWHLNKSSHEWHMGFGGTAVRH
jgi:hypothetical protein